MYIAQLRGFGVSGLRVQGLNVPVLGLRVSGFREHPATKGLGASCGGFGLPKKGSLEGVYAGFHMGGRQNYGPFLGPYYTTAPII